MATQKTKATITPVEGQLENKIKFATAMITITGDSDLILNKMRDSTSQALADKQEGKVQGTKQTVNKYEHLIGSLHWLKPLPENIEYTEETWSDLLKNNIPGYPSSGLKKACCDAVVRVIGETYSTKFNANMQILDTFLPIEFESVTVDKSLFSPVKGSPVLCYRNVFHNWKTTFTIKYMPDNYSTDQILEVINCAGFACGIGSHRPSSKGGSNGMFHVSSIVEFKNEEKKNG